MNPETTEADDVGDEDIVLPRRSVDPDETLEDRLTANIRTRAGPERYFLRDGSGDLIEDGWDDVFERVAQNVAMAEAVFADKPVAIKADSPALAEWVDDEVKHELFDIEDPDGIGLGKIADDADTYVHDGVATRRLDEELVSYLEYDGLLERLPDDIAETVDKTAAEFEDLMRTQQFMPNSPTLMNAGSEVQQLSACFVDSPEDSIESLNQTESEWTLIQKTGGGIGGAFHKLRPKGHPISTTGGVSSGPLSFMTKYDLVAGVIKQGGCVATNERVMTSEGYLPLGNVYDGPALGTTPSDKRVRTRGGDMDEVIESSDSGQLPAVTVTTNAGYTITVTEDHPLLTLSNGEIQFTEAGEITDDDTVVLSLEDKRTPIRETLEPIGDDYHHNTNIPESVPETMTDDLATFLGVLWGDGTISYSETGKIGDRVIFSLGNDGNGDQSAQEFLERFCAKHGISLRSSDRSDTDKGNYTRYEIASSAFVDWLDQNNLAKDSESLHEIPEAIYRSPAAIPAFLGGLTVDAHLNKDASTVVYSTANELFAETIQDLLLVTGIPSRVSEIKAGEDKFSDESTYTVQVFPGQYTATYDDIVPHLLSGDLGTSSGERQNALASPDAIERILDENFVKGNKLPSGVDESAVKSLRRYARGDRVPSLERVRSCFTKAGVAVEDYDVLDANNLYEPVSSVEPAGSVQVCDIENKTGAPEYIASNFVVHNKRRGAQMGIMHSQHPDIGRFAVSKRTEDGLTNFNISAAFSDEFIQAIEHDETYELKFPIDSDEPYEVTPEVAHFYDPKFEDAWNDDFDKPATGYDGIAVEENFWRDYLPDTQDPEAFDEYRDWFEPETEDGTRPLEPGQDLELPAGFVFQMIIDGAHNNGEPGLIHYDEINREHSFDTEENPERIIEATNPCGEQPLQKYEACNLGHINLSLVADDEAPTWLEYNAVNDDATMREYLDVALDTEHLTEIGELGTRFLDNVVTMSKFPLEEIEDRVRNMRKIGLGLMGFHQLLLQLGIEYGTDESEAAAEDIMRRIDTTATLQSQHLAEERGVFGEYEDSKWSELDKHPEWARTHAHVDPDEVDGSMKVRNHNMTTIAPTGTTSMIGDTSAGCEPIYSVAFFKNVGDDIQGEEMLVEFDEYFLRVLEANDIDVEAVKAEATEQMMESEFDGIDSLDRVPDTIGDLFVTTDDLALEDHIGVQSAFQIYCDSGISKTLNAPNETTIGEVGDAYIQALKSGIKGATVYRDGSRDEQVKTTRATGNNLDEADVVDAEVVAELLVRGELGAQLDLWDLVDEGMIDAETLESLEEHGAPIEIKEPAE